MSDYVDQFPATGSVQPIEQNLFHRMLGGWGSALSAVGNGAEAVANAMTQGSPLGRSEPLAAVVRHIISQPLIDQGQAFTDWSQGFAPIQGTGNITQPQVNAPQLVNTVQGAMPLFNFARAVPGAVRDAARDFAAATVPSKIMPTSIEASGLHNFGEGEPIEGQWFHGTDQAAFKPDVNNTVWFTDSENIADQYRRRAIFNSHEFSDRDLEGIDLEDADTPMADQLGDVGVKQMLDEAGVDHANMGSVIPSKLRAKSVFDVDKAFSDGGGLIGGNVGDVEEAWGRLNKLGMVNEPWHTIDPDIQQELRDDFEGKGTWRFLEQNGVYDWLRKNGHDAVKITDVDMNGHEHDAIGLLGKE